VLGGAALEALDAATGVDQLLLARVEGVALGAELDMQIVFGRPRVELVAARAVHVGKGVIGVDLCLHFSFQSRELVKPCRYAYVATRGQTRKHRSRHALRLAIGIVLGGGALIVALHDWLGIGSADLDGFIDGPLYDTVVLSAGFACLLRADDGPRERAAWLFIGAAVLAWGAGEIYWTAYIEGNPDAPYPSPADLGYLAFYPLAAAGLFQLVRSRAHELDWRLWMDGLIAALGTAALGAALIFEFVASRTSGTTVQVATTLAYPLGDIVLLSLVVGIAALTRWRPGRTWTLLLAGLVVMAVADVAFTLQSYEASLPGGDWVEPIYLLSALFIGAAAWQPSTATIRRDARFDGWRELMVPGFFAAVMIALFSMQYFSSASGLTTILWAATMIAVIVRLGLSVRENKRLLEQVKTDQLTGLGNQGRLQVDLEARCLRAEQEPLTLLMLDLNGFKRYNDTFGHPAGDEILTRMGAQLDMAVGAEGSAYRIGGDEFVVLTAGADGRHGPVAKRAAEALTASGKGYALNAAWGSVTIPDEADTPAAAMQLADVRMYAQKESRRLSHDDALEIEGAAVSVELRASRDSEALEQGQ
jgi:two-component system cell cycle response regulator